MIINSTYTHLLRSQSATLYLYQMSISHPNVVFYICKLVDEIGYDEM